MKVKGAFLYFRPGHGLEIACGKVGRLTGNEDGTTYVYLYNTEGDVRPPRHAVETLVKSLQEWLDAPENGGLEADVYTGGEVFARQTSEGAKLFQSLPTANAEIADPWNGVPSERSELGTVEEER